MICAACTDALPDVGGLREAVWPRSGPSEHIWHYVGKRERVRVLRVWTGYPPMDDEQGDHIAVRCHPLHGGRSWTAPLCAFRERFARNETDAASHGKERPA